MPDEVTGAAVRGIQPHSQPKDENKDRSIFPQSQLDLELTSKGPTRSTFNKARELLKQPATEVVICPTPSENTLTQCLIKRSTSLHWLRDLFWSEILLGKSENVCPHKNPSLNVLGGFNHYSPEREMIQIVQARSIREQTCGGVSSGSGAHPQEEPQPCFLHHKWEPILPSSRGRRHHTGCLGLFRCHFRWDTIATISESDQWLPEVGWGWVLGWETWLNGICTSVIFCRTTKSSI